ncbi:MAG: threonyl-tRNA synthetase editing domain-containing protein [Actinomycetota bacterium]|nr:threonyl-tRNA synthetase editing domain-containing protein [Actinomycetota bacterium]
MIVRIMGEGQYRVDDALAQELNELDEQVASAVESGDEERTGGLLQQLAKTVRDRGERLDDSDLSTSDAIVPPEDLSLDEIRELLEGEGLIPDLPTA